MTVKTDACRDNSIKRKERYHRILAKHALYYGAAEKCTGGETGMQSVTCAYVIAPAANGYIQWLLRESLARGVERVYFLARDAYLMYLVAKKYCERFSLPIDCRYLYCSRYSLRIPVYHRDMSAAMDYICRGGIDVTFRKILGRTGISEEDRQETLTRICSTVSDDRIRPYIEDPDKAIPYANLAAIREIMEADGQLRTCIRNNSEKAAPALDRYLHQEGLYDDVSMVIADSGWVGSMQRSLGQAAGKDLEGFYWGLYEIPADMPPERYHCYYFSPSGGAGGSGAVPGLNNTVHFSNCLFEGIFSAPHGMTLGYRCTGTPDEEADVVPVLADCAEKRSAFIKNTEKVIMNYTNSLFEIVPEDASEKEFKEFPMIPLRVVKSLMSTLMSTPCRDEAEVFGSIPFSDDVQSEGSEPIAAILSEEELTDNHVVHKALNMLGSRRKHIHESAWYEGSAVNCSRHPAKHIRAYTQYKRMLVVKKLIKYKREHNSN